MGWPLFLPSFQVLLVCSSVSFFWIGVHFGSIAFDHLTGLEAILLAKHAQIKSYQGDVRLDLLQKFDIIIAENGPAIENDDPTGKIDQDSSAHRAINENDANSPELSKKSAYGVLNDTNTYKNIYSALESLGFVKMTQQNRHSRRIFHSTPNPLSTPLDPYGSTGHLCMKMSRF